MSVKKVPRVRRSVAYDRARFTVIVCLMATNSFGAAISILNHRYPIGLMTILFLIPCLLRELDLRNGRPLRRHGSFEWSCFIAGFLFSWQLCRFSLDVCGGRRPQDAITRPPPDWRWRLPSKVAPFLSRPPVGVAGVTAHKKTMPLPPRY
jgi:hypothetical protein